MGEKDRPPPRIMQEWPEADRMTDTRLEGVNKDWPTIKVGGGDENIDGIIETMMWIKKFHSSEETISTVPNQEQSGCGLPDARTRPCPH